MGALVATTKDGKGGVLIIPHRKELCDNVVAEKWIVQGGRQRIEGAPAAGREEKGTGNKTHADAYNAAGSELVVMRNQG